MGSTRSKRLTRENWIEAAAKILVRKSIDAVGVESVARTLRVTKGSFYHHFKNRPDMLRAILDSWRKRQTLAVMARIEGDGNLPPRERLSRAIELPLRSKIARDAASLELAIRAWGRRDRLAREAITEVDAERLAYVRSLVQAAGLRSDRVPIVAFLIYANTIAEAWITEDESDTARSSRHAYLLDLLVGGAATEVSIKAVRGL